MLFFPSTIGFYLLLCVYSYPATIWWLHRTSFLSLSTRLTHPGIYMGQFCCLVNNMGLKKCITNSKPRSPTSVPIICPLSAIWGNPIAEWFWRVGGALLGVTRVTPADLSPITNLVLLGLNWFNKLVHNQIYFRKKIILFQNNFLIVLAI